MEEILTIGKEILRYGLLGILLLLCIMLILKMYQEIKTLQSEFRKHLQDNNDRFLIVVEKNTDGYEKMINSFDNNSMINKNMSLMIEKKLDVLDILKKTK